jgi:IclR family transcriptional regulator, acetate operon repressor
MKDLSKRDEVRVILKAMDLLISLAEGSLTVVQLSERAGVSIPAVYRILKTLDSGGFVIRDSQNREYALGPALIGLGRATRNSVELMRHVRPALRELHERYNETVNLGVLCHGKIIYLETIESHQTLRVTVPMKVEDNFHTTALGKAILAAIPDDLLLETIQESRLMKQTVNNLVSQQQLLATIKKSRTLGYAIDNEEDEIGFRCVAAPILNSSNFPIAAISVTAPISHTSLKDFALIGRYLVSVCASLKKTIPTSFS